MAIDKTLPNEVRKEIEIEGQDAALEEQIELQEQPNISCISQV